jgi:hypothetical protein
MDRMNESVVVLDHLYQYTGKLVWNTLTTGSIDEFRMLSGLVFRILSVVQSVHISAICGACNSR